jgi:periplasmic protein TonB
MRRVYTPPPSNAGLAGPLFGALGLSLLVFLVLPLTQMVSSGLNKTLTLSKVDVAELAPPVDDSEPPPPPPENKPEEPPPPELSDAPQPLNLNVDLDMAVGAGGALAAGFGGYGQPDASEGLDALDIADLEKRPELIASVAPKYPAELRKARVEGRVTILFLLDENGQVQDPRIETSSRPEFEKPALEAVRRWRFKPGMKDGQAVRTFMRLPMRFRVSSS